MTSRRWSYSLCFAVPFVLALVTITGIRLQMGSTPQIQQVEALAQVLPAASLAGYILPVEGLIEAQSRAPASNQGLFMPDTAVVILLGGISCSANQMKLLRYWSEQPAATGLPDYPVLALYADPLLGIEQGAYESLLLRRVSQAKFPFLVSQDPDFNLRAMGIRTPQVVLVESQVITHVFSPTIEPIPPVSQ